MIFKKINNDFNMLTGKIGISESELNPKGTVLIEDEIFEVTAEDGFVETGRGVKVTRVQGRKIFVRRV